MTEDVLRSVRAVRDPAELREFIALQWELVRAIDEKIAQLQENGWSYGAMERQTGRIISAQQFHGRAAKARRAEAAPPESTAAR
jgi:hypothetical protein